MPDDKGVVDTKKQLKTVVVVGYDPSEGVHPLSYSASMYAGQYDEKLKAAREAVDEPAKKKVRRKLVISGYNLVIFSSIFSSGRFAYKNM